MIITIDTDKPLNLADAFTLRELIEHWHPTFPVGGKTVVNKDELAPEDTVDEDAALDEEEEQKAKLPKTVDKTRKRKADGEPGPKTKASLAEQTVQQQAIALATRLVSEDRTDKVRQALESIGESRVSLLTEEQAAAFLEAVGE